MLDWIAFAVCVIAMIVLASWAINKISSPGPSDAEDVDEYKGAWYD